MKGIYIDPKEDGVTHIRVHPKARTFFGRLLSSCALTPIEVPDWGRWSSMDALCIGLATGQLSVEVRALSLVRATRELFYLSRENLRLLSTHADVVALGFECKLDQTSLTKDRTLRTELMQNKLPLINYTVVDGEVVEDDLPPHLLARLKVLRAQKRARRKKPAKKKKPARLVVSTKSRTPVA